MELFSRVPLARGLHPEEATITFLVKLLERLLV
jgi:hypothetical protein